MLKRRDKFCQQIRRRERDSWKNHIRMKLIQEQSQNIRQNRGSNPNLNQQFRWIETMFRHNHQQEENYPPFVKQFCSKIQSLMSQYFDGEHEMREPISPRSVLVTFSQYLVSNNTPHQIQKILQCFQSLFIIKDQYFQKEDVLRMQLQEAELLIQWNSAINMIFLVILHIKSIKNQPIASQSQMKMEFYQQKWMKEVNYVLRMLCQEDNFNVTYHETILQSIKELHQYCILSYNRANYSSINKTIDSTIVQGLIKALRSYQMDPLAKLLILEMFSLVAINRQTVESYARIIEADFCSAAKLLLLFEANVNSTENTGKYSQVIFQNILKFISDGSYLCSSDTFWENGICGQLRQIQNSGLKNKQMHSQLVICMFICIITISCQAVLTALHEEYVSDWVMKVLRQSVEKRAYDQNMGQLIQDAIQVIKFFYECAEMKKNQQNPFIIKLQYSCGIQILQSCPEGIQFLEEIHYMQVQL